MDWSMSAEGAEGREGTGRGMVSVALLLLCFGFRRRGRCSVSALCDTESLVSPSCRTRARAWESGGEGSGGYGSLRWAF